MFSIYHVKHDIMQHNIAIQRFGTAAWAKEIV